MLRVASMLYAIVAPTLAGAGVIAVLVMGASGVVPIVAAAAAGAVLALPVSYVIANKIVS
ncbi:CTP synthetase [Roseobacter weihaiensis]|uniref:CTP synthetase n=1 Tax=Roseobacter weihaiensis TaxID=2763262 RepID=UPI001D0B1C28|nr:CTP synthetase [Roseobacter sp. H9]